MDIDEVYRNLDLRQFGYAPGDYYCKCSSCRTVFVGAKRSTRCFSCALTAHGRPDEDDIEVRRPARMFAPTHRHRKTGGLYKLLTPALLEADLSHVAVYEGEDGTVWVRPLDQFTERFDALVAPINDWK